MFGTKVVTDADKINELLTRGVDEVIELEHLRSRLLKGEELHIKLGIDPTSPNIHIGRAILLWKLRAFQDLGHKAIFIVGDFTGLIGDTSDKDSERPMLTEAQVKSNMVNYFHQAYKILDKKKTEVHFNSDWLKKLSSLEICKIADLFGLHEFEAREVIARRMKSGKRVSLREILYPIFQGYDSVFVKADVELGGTDQRFNLLAGRTIQPLYGQKPQDIVMMNLLEGTDKRKMSSSFGNVINITDEPNDMFGKVMSIYDGEDNLVIRRYLERATKIPMTEVKELEQKLKNGTNPRDIKKRLAEEVVTLYHGAKAAQEASKEWEKVFSKGELPSELREVEGGRLLDLIEVSSSVSSTQAKRLVEQGAVSVNGEVVKDWNLKVKGGNVVQIGPKTFVKVK